MSGALTLVRDGQTAASAVPDTALPARSVSGAASQRVRIVDGVLACIAAQGLAKTTLDDIARAAGCSRATVYRAFPGGKDAVLRAAVDTECSRLFSELAVEMGEADDLEGVLVAGMTGAAERISRHLALGFLLQHEPEVVLPHLAFDRHDRVLAVVRAYGTPFLGRWLDRAEAERVAEWAARIVLSYLGCPAADVDLTDADQVRRVVRTYMLPGIRVLAGRTGQVPDAAGAAPSGAGRPPISHNSISHSEGEAS